MKYAMMSDVHSNPLALKAALADAKAMGCGRFVFLGDVTGYGYDVAGALNLVRENFDVALLGNHDSISSGLESNPEIMANPHYDVDREQGGRFSKEEREWLKGRRHVYKNRKHDFACVHGDFVAPGEWGYIMDEDDAMASFRVMSEKLLFCGHLHHAMVFGLSADGEKVSELYADKLDRPACKAESVTFKPLYGCRYIVNCGSVGNPRYDLCTAYAIYDTSGGEVTIRRLPFDFKSYTFSMIDAKVKLPLWLVSLINKASA